MPRPPAASVDMLVDAEVCAQAGSTIERTFAAAELPRLTEAGVLASSQIDGRFHFLPLEGRPAVEGRLTGTIVMTCQRCMNPVPVRIGDEFRVVILNEERADEPGGYEPVLANPARFDLRWLAEEQVLLALPLVPMHEPGECEPSAAPDEARDEVRQQPFRNLRELLRER